MNEPNNTTVSQLPSNWASEVRKLLQLKNVFVSSKMVEATILENRDNKHKFVIQETFLRYSKEVEKEQIKLDKLKN
jgi:hypothetical protein